MLLKLINSGKFSQLAKRAALGDRQKFERAMAKVADVAPPEYDAL